MTHDHEEIRLYLAGEDSRERANRMAEMAKQHIKRKCALQFGDSGSHPIPLESCRMCDDGLNDLARSPVPGICRPCLEESTSLKSMEIANRNRATDAPPSDWPKTLCICGLIIAFVPPMVWVICMMIYRMAGGQ